MKQNMGLADRILRISAATVMMTLYGTGIMDGTLGIALLVLSVIFLITGFIGICPLYLPFDIRTIKTTSKKQKIQ